MSNLEQWIYLTIAAANAVFTKSITLSIGISTILISVLLIAIYNEVKEINKGE